MSCELYEQVLYTAINIHFVLSLLQPFKTRSYIISCLRYPNTITKWHGYWQRSRYRWFNG